MEVKKDFIDSKYFILAIQALIIISIITFSLSTIPDLSPQQIWYLNIVETITIIVFTIEYIIRIVASKSKAKFIFSFYGIIDLAVILPFYLSLGVDLRSMRVVRLLSLLRIFKLVKYSKSINLFIRAFTIAKDEIILFGVFSLIVLYLSAVGIYYCENPAQPDQFKSIFHSLWWALTTLTTVGYGDMFPITAGGKLFTFFVLLLGLGIVAVPTGLVASALAKARAEQKSDLKTTDE